MKILVAARHFGYLRNFESALEELAQRGHTVHLVADREESTGGRQMVERLATRCPAVTVGWTTRREKDDPWFDLATRVRLSQDYLRYLDRAYDQTPMLRRRAKERTPPATVWLVERAGFRFRPGRAMLRAAFDALEHGVPLYEPYVKFLQEVKPDVVILTPLIDLGSPQLDMLKAARALGLPTVLAVGSWDHLSSKALIRIGTDLITVWNDVQRREAEQMHGVPSAQVAVTGAQCYDRWFNRQPSRSRQEFCRDMGLQSDRPFILYVCSSLFRGDPPEADFTVSWIRAVRQSADPRLAGIGILVRPHPGRMAEWTGHDVASLGVVLHGGNPIDDRSRDDYFDALHYSAAVVGLNTSAFLEAGIVGKPVLAILPKPYWKSQEGTLHFHYLTTVGGGLLRISRSIEEHLPQLAAAVAGDAPARNDDFVRAFIRPFGLDEPATPRFADAVEALARGRSSRPWRPTVSGRMIGPVLKMAAAAKGRRKRSKRLRQDAAHEVRKARERMRRRFLHGRRWIRDAAVSTRQRLRPATPRRVLVKPDDFERTDEFQDLLETLERARRSGRPVVVGPWLSEVGFELLYWIPFLRWAKAYAQIRDDRMIILSRGGTATWYGDIGTRYVDVFDLCSVEDFHARNVQRIELNDGQKHFVVAPFDQELLKRLQQRLGLGAVEWLHPGLMYTVFRGFWTQVASSELVRRFSVPRRLRVPPANWPNLPTSYVAVKFYENAGLPDGREVQRFVKTLLSRLARETHVVVLQSGLTVDDHAEFPLDERGRLVQIDHLLTPANNLDVQTRVVAGADAFVCTYGGFSYLGPLCGIPTLAFYSNAQAFRLDHLSMALRTFRDLAAAPFVAMSLRDAAVAEQMLGRPSLIQLPS